MNLNKRTLIIIGSIFGVIIVTLSIVGFVMQSRSTSETPDETGYVDPGSGEVIKTDKSPQGTEDQNENAVIYPGFSKLLDRGLSTEQIQSIQNAIIAFSLQEDKKFKEVSLDVSTIGRLLPKHTGGYHSVYFVITVNRTEKYFIDTQYENMNSIKTKIHTEDEATLLFER